MSLVNVLNVIVKQSKTPFQAPIAFDIYFESVKSLKHSLTWRIIYIGQASNDQYDQILEEAEMDCEVAGRMMFTLEVSHFPNSDLCCRDNTQTFPSSPRPTSWV